MTLKDTTSTEITALKLKVKEIISEVNVLKDQLEKREITLEKFKEKKEILENELRGILDQISQYKEKGTLETKKDAFIAEEAKRLMYEFQTYFSDYISKPLVYLSATLIDHFTFEIDFSNYPEKPKLTASDSCKNLFKVPFETKISLLDDWESQNPPHITEIFYEIENILMKIFRGELFDIVDINLRQARKVVKRWKLFTDAEYEMELKNIEKAIDLYQQVLQISFELEDFENSNKYAQLIVQLKEELKKNN
ncbi:MAG: hypothetical protein ACFFD2_01945 [Promethearchaeota archaeon]